MLAAGGRAAAAAGARGQAGGQGQRQSQENGPLPHTSRDSHNMDQIAAEASWGQPLARTGPAAARDARGRRAQLRPSARVWQAPGASARPTPRLASVR